MERRKSNLGTVPILTQRGTDRRLVGDYPVPGPGSRFSAHPKILSKRAPLGGLVVAVLVALSGCRPADDLPAPPATADRAVVSGPDFQQAPSTDGLGDTSDQGAASHQEVPQRQTSTPAESPGEPLEADREGVEPLPGFPTGETETRPQPAESEAPATDGEPATGTVESRSTDMLPEPVQEAQSEPPLPPPMVDDPKGLQRLHPSYPVWIDRQRKHVIMVGRVCQRRAPLELFACIRHSKEHESVVAVDTQAYVVHAGLLATEAEPGSPVQFVPEFRPPTGTEIEVTVVWEDGSGRRRQARAEDWVRDVAGLYDAFEGVVANEFDDELNLQDQPDAFRDMPYPWVFAGSQFVVDEQTGRQSYLADGEGDLICVSNFPSAVLDVPIRSSDSNAALMFEAFTERIPPIGTPVTLILTPKIEKKGEQSGQVGD